MTDKTTQQSVVERVARAIEADLIRQASMQSGVEYTPADECGMASANMNLIPTELAQAAIAALHPKVSEAEVREVFLGVRGWLQSAPLESGYCCCGSPVERHGFGDGHSPVDELRYAAGMQVECIDALLVRLNQGEKA